MQVMIIRLIITFLVKLIGSHALNIIFNDKEKQTSGVEINGNSLEDILYRRKMRRKSRRLWRKK